MWNQLKILEKMSEDLNCHLFRSPKWLGSWASEADIQHTSKSSSNWHVNEDWCETSGNVLRKWPKTGILTYLGPKVAKNWASDVHILYTSKITCNEHVKQYWCETIHNLLRKWPTTRNLIYLRFQNGPKIGPLRPILYTFMKVAPMNIQSKIGVNPEETFSQNNKNNNWILIHFKAQNGPKMGPLGPIFHTP